MIGKRRKKTLNRELWLMFSAVLILFVVTFVVTSTFVSQRASYDYEIRESETTINGVSGSVTASIGTYKNLSRLVMLNKEAVTLLRAKNATISMINDARYGVMDVMNATTNLDSIFIFRNDGDFMNTGKGLYDLDLTLMKKPAFLCVLNSVL